MSPGSRGTATHFLVQAAGTQGTELRAEPVWISETQQGPIFSVSLTLLGDKASPARWPYCCDPHHCGMLHLSFSPLRMVRPSG